MSVARFKRDKIYYFKYNPKLAEVLPFWDKRPFMFPLHITSTHTLGINLHWIPKRFKKKFIELLLQMSQRIPNQQRFSRLTYNMLKADISLRPALRGIRLYSNKRARNIQDITKEMAQDPNILNKMEKSLFRKHKAKKVFYPERSRN